MTWSLMFILMWDLLKYKASLLQEINLIAVMKRLYHIRQSCINIIDVFLLNVE